MSVRRTKIVSTLGPSSGDAEVLEKMIAAGMDVVSAEEIILNPGDRHPVATGFALAIPEGYEIQVRPRSGLALKHGITLPNAPGTTVYFPVIQECEKGANRWVEPVVAGQPEPPQPMPGLRIVNP